MRKIWLIMRREYLYNFRKRSFLFSASLPVPIVAAASTILDMLEADGEALVKELHEKSAYMRKGLTEIGFDLGDSNTHIMPIMIRDETKAMFTHVALLENGVLMVPIMYPAVKVGEERLRLNVTRGHSYEDIDQALGEAKAWRQTFASSKDLRRLSSEVDALRAAADVRFEKLEDRVASLSVEHGKANAALKGRITKEANKLRSEIRQDRAYLADVVGIFCSWLLRMKPIFASERVTRGVFCV